MFFPEKILDRIGALTDRFGYASAINLTEQREASPVAGSNIKELLEHKCEILHCDFITRIYARDFSVPKRNKRIFIRRSSVPLEDVRDMTPTNCDKRCK